MYIRKSETRNDVSVVSTKTALIFKLNGVCNLYKVFQCFFTLIRQYLVLL